jgi:hypothetical protein
MLCCSAEQHEKFILFVPSFRLNTMIVAEICHIMFCATRQIIQLIIIIIIIIINSITVRSHLAGTKNKYFLLYI